MTLAAERHPSPSLTVNRIAEVMPLRCQRSRDQVRGEQWPGPRPAATRRGVTLLELLVVLVLMAIASALVVPALRFPSTSAGVEDSDSMSGRKQTGLIPTPEVDGILANARRLALKRGEPMRLRVASDGVWAIAPVSGGTAIRNGRITQTLSWQPDLTIDAIGACVLSPNVVPRAGADAWDALACRWRETQP